jgi:hypothetical protein
MTRWPRYFNQALPNRHTATPANRITARFKKGIGIKKSEITPAMQSPLPPVRQNRVISLNLNPIPRPSRLRPPTTDVPPVAFSTAGELFRAIPGNPRHADSV